MCQTELSLERPMWSPFHYPLVRIPERVNCNTGELARLLPGVSQSNLRVVVINHHYWHAIKLVVHNSAHALQVV